MTNTQMALIVLGLVPPPHTLPDAPPPADVIRERRSSADIDLKVLEVMTKHHGAIAVPTLSCICQMTDAVARRAVERMVSRGHAKHQQTGRYSYYSITAAGKKAFKELRACH